MDDLLDRVREISRENQRLFERLMEGEQRYRGLARSVWRVQEDERRRLARDLHDGIGQTLTALKNELTTLEQRSQDDGAIEHCRRLADDALAETRELSRLLRPPVLDDLGLPAALSWLARTLGDSAGLDIDVQTDSDFPRIDSDLETMLFRIAQEALNNAVKHAEAERAWVRLHRTETTLVLEVTDDGRGFDLAAVEPGTEPGTGSFGLHGMRDRAELFGARLSIESDQVQGTRVLLEVESNGTERKRGTG